MYLVTIENEGTLTEIHGSHQKLASGKVVQSINTIDSFTFSVLPSNIGFDMLNDFTTLVTVYNTLKERYEFRGRVLYSSASMSDSGQIKRDVTCESLLGFLCDSQQMYVAEKNWTVRGLLSHILNYHNLSVETYKRIYVGNVDEDLDSNDNVYCGIQYQNSWNTIKEKLIDSLGGEIRIRVEDGLLYLDYLKQLGEAKTTEIALSKNMKAVTQEKNPSELITRLIPLGYKLGDSEQRLTIGSPNYIDDEESKALYGIHVGFVEFDDVTETKTLKSKGESWLKSKNKVNVKYTADTLDLSLIGLAVDDFEVHNTYPIKNALLGIGDEVRVIKKNIDICNEIDSSIELGEKFLTSSEIQRNQRKEFSKGKEIYATKSSLKQVENKIPDVSNFVTNDVLESKLPDTSDFATKEEVEAVENKIPDTSGFMTEQEVENLIDDKLEKIDVENGSVVYNTSIYEERRTYYNIDTRYLARNGLMSLDGLDITAVMGESGACFPLVLNSKRIIKEIIIRTAHGSTLTISPRQFDSNVEDGTWVFAQVSVEEGGDATTVTILCESAEDTIAQLLIITE